MSGSKFNKRFMMRAIELAQESSLQGEVPVGAVIVHKSRVIGEGSNTIETNKNSIQHAEINAINEAISNYGHKHLLDTEIYISLEPCSMCAGAIVLARIPRLIIAARDPKSGACGSVLNITDNKSLNHRCEVEFGMMEKEASEMIKSFFKELRGS